MLSRQDTIQYKAALNKTARSNNVSEAWHNRFNVLVGNSHPDLYSAILELQREQAYTEVCVQELALGKRVKSMSKKKWVDLQERIQGLASSYLTYKNSNTVSEYLKTIAHNIKM